jgi:hypothetical protein
MQRTNIYSQDNATGLFRHILTSVTSFVDVPNPVRLFHSTCPLGHAFLRSMDSCCTVPYNPTPILSRLSDEWGIYDRYRCWSSGLLCRTDFRVSTNVSEEHTASVFRDDQPWGWRHYVPPIPTSSHGITSQNTNTDIFTNVRTSNLIHDRQLWSWNSPDPK